MNVYKLASIFIATIFIEVCFCQVDMQGDPLMKSDFQSYALNMGGTLVDLLRKEISMLSKINPLNTPPNPLGGVPPVIPTGGILASSSSVPLPPGAPLPAPVIYPPQVGKVPVSPAIPSIPIPAAGISASGGSTVYSIGTNYAPLTVINVYGDMPPNSSIIAQKGSQQSLENRNDQEKTPQSSLDITVSNSSINVGSKTDNSPISNTGAPSQGGCDNKTSGECKNKDDSPLSTVGEMKNGTNPNRLEGTSPELSEQPISSNAPDSSDTLNTNMHPSNMTTTASPTTTVSS